MENSRATFEGLQRAHPVLRPFVLTRATYAGGQRYAATWTGDNSSTWNHLRLTTPMLENLGLSGFVVSGADVGGFAGTPQPDLLTKWFEIASFQPIDRDHTEKGSGDQEPWVGGPEPEAIRRRFIEERYRLMPYLYTLAEEASRTGLPMERPLFLEFPEATARSSSHRYRSQAAGEFLLGPDILVAAPPYPDKMDNYTSSFLRNGTTIGRDSRSPRLHLERWGPKCSRKPQRSRAACGLDTSRTRIPASLCAGGTILPIAPLCRAPMRNHKVR